MEKTEFLALIAKIYRLANMSDSDNPAKPAWMHATDCAVICGALDDAMQSRSFNANERQEFYDNL
jgi:hypothetical protein